MSKSLWILCKSLLVSPAVLLAMLLISANAVRAAQEESQLASENQVTTIGTKFQPNTNTSATKFLQKTEVKSAAMSDAAPIGTATDLQSPTTADVKLPEQVAVTSTTKTVVAPEAAPSVEMSRGATQEATPAMPTVTQKVAQAAPTTPSDSSTLQQINRYSNEGRGSGDSIDQVTNVSQFSDVRPGDWAYEALRELVERYGCIAGYPDSTYRGNRALTRYEFAAGLRACLNQIEKLIAASTSDFATKEDLEKLRRLTQEFQAELATLGTRVDKLEGRVGFLENHQFSTTTKLVGEAIFAVSDPIRTRGGTRSGVSTSLNGTRTDDKNTVFGDRIRLEFQTSFTGKDILHTRLATGNLRPFNLGLSDRTNNRTGPGFGGITNGFNTYEGQQTFNYTGSGNFNNNIALDWLAYEFPYQSSKVYIAATGALHSDYAPVLNPYFYDGDGGNGSLSTFAQESPIYRIGGGAGGGIRFGVGKIGILGPTSITFGYLAGNANSPLRSSGLTGGDYGALGQINFNLFDRLAIAGTYVNGYSTNGAGIYNVGLLGQPLVGSTLANFPSELSPRASAANASPNVAQRFGRISTNSYGVEAAFRLTDKISISGFGLKTAARVLGSGGGDGQIWSYGGGVAFVDFGKKGNVLGFFGGLEPTLRGFHVNGAATTPFRNSSSYHLEGFYKYQLTDNISVTPGVIWITAPNQDNRDPNNIIGTFRTTFTF